MTQDKTCTRCRETKDLAEFGWKNKAQGRRHTYCKACVREISRDTYQRKREYYLLKAARQRKTQIKQIKQAVYDYLKAHPCVDCGESNPVCLEFDHVRGRKHKAISVMITSAASITAVMEEINKCEVRCANCHRKKTAQQQRWYNSLQ